MRGKALVVAFLNSFQLHRCNIKFKRMNSITSTTDKTGITNIPHLLMPKYHLTKRRKAIV